MMKMNGNGIFILSLSLYFVTTSAYCDIENKERLMQKCRYLSQNVFSLVSNQERKSCIEKLTQAAMHVDKAGDWITEERYASAKDELTNAVYLLQFAEFNNCRRYIQISHAKFEAQKIKKNLQG